VRGEGLSAARIAALLAPLEREAIGALRGEGHSPTSLRLEREADLRYRGQSHELTLPVTAGLEEAFHSAHGREFGHERRQEEVELVTLRVRAMAPAPALRERGGPFRRRKRAAPFGAQPAVLPNGRRAEVFLYRRADLRAGDFLRGPALVTEYSATTWVAAGFHLEADRHGILSLRPTGGGDS
jgi:N-methylhydantoinase A